MKLRFLVTTSNEDTWPKENQPILFLGEWCRLYSRREVWESLDAFVLPYHWDDREKLKNDYNYLIGLHEELLRELTVELNNIHQTNHSVLYWRILIGPWLGYFTQIFFDRWSSVKQCFDEFNLSGTIIYEEADDTIIPNDMDDFLGFLKSRDDWNHYLYSKSIIFYNQIPKTFIKKKLIEFNKKSAPKRSVLSKIKQNVFKLISGGFLLLFKKKNDLVLVNTYLPFWEEVKLLFRFHQLPFLGTFPAVPKITASEKFRNWTFKNESKNDFEKILRTIIPKQVPKAYLEGYTQIKKIAFNLHLPSQPKLIWTSNSHSADDIFKIWAAEKVEEKCPLIIGQHGGHYGIGLYSFYEDHELAISKHFLSWGWKLNNSEKVIPVGQIKLKKPLKKNHSTNTRMLLVTNMVPRQSYCLYSCTISKQWLDYQNDQYAFVESLPHSLRSELIVRLIPWDWGWSPAKRWKDKFQNIIIDEGYTDINILLKKTRLYISTYNATTFLESFTMGIPTIIFWNPNHWELRDAAIPYFDELKKVGVFHETPESAARQVQIIWDDVDQWWNSKEVTKVINMFKKEYCDLSDDIVLKLESAFKEIIKAENLD
jgi:putative transferase (TIGR04331 family)